MGQSALHIDEVEREAVRLLSEAREAQALSLRALEEMTSVSRARASRIFRGEVSCSVTEFQELAAALGLVASSVVREAEEAVARRAGLVVEHETNRPATDAEAVGQVIALEEARRAAEVEEETSDFSRMAAKYNPHHARELEETTGWRNDLGEESQVGPDWEE